MLKRFKRALVESYVGAIALGYLLAETVLHFCYTFATPVSGWVSRTEYRDPLGRTTLPQGFRLQEGLPELVRFVVLLVSWCLLMYWLYVKREKTEVPASEQQMP